MLLDGGFMRDLEDVVWILDGLFMSLKPPGWENKYVFSD
jgi:hypothetical protein